VTTFALVHGAWHGAWCWDLLVPELERRGGRALALELPCEDPEAGCSAYAEVVLRALPAGDEDVVLVGHSLGGLTIPLVAARRRVRRLVFLCALIAEPGLSFVDQVEREPEIFVPGFGDALQRDELRRSYWPAGSAEQAIADLYADCPRALAEDAFARLRRQGRAPNTERCELAAWPDGECVSILGREDAAISPDWSRRAARARLGSEAVEIDGAHSPFVARPGELADLLVAGL
jgi:pimeloyl-ACP methyl ester carboxylesterase